MAEGLFRAQLAARSSALTVGSQGLMPGGVPAVDDVVKVMARRGIDMSGHVSRQVDPVSVGEAQLVVAMTRQHLITLGAEVPGAWGRSFQLVELTQRVAALGGPRPGEGLGAWVTRLGSGRSVSGVLSLRLSDDIPDPMGQRRSAFEKTADLLEHLLDPLADAVAGPVSVRA